MCLIMIVCVLVRRSWFSVRTWLRSQSFFNDYFVQLPSEQVPWHSRDAMLDSDDTRIPYDLLESGEADTVYRNHVTKLREEFRLNE